MLRHLPRPSKALAGLLLLGILYSLGLVVAHTHLSGDYRPTCPACHQERSIGCTSGALPVVHLAPTLVPATVIPDVSREDGRSAVAIRESAPRSPPAVI